MSVIEPKRILTVTQPCFIVASDPAMHFGDCVPVASGFGAVLKEIEHPDIFRHLQEFIAAEEPEWVDRFSLVVPESQSPVLLGRFRVEMDRTDQLEASLHLDPEDFEAQPPVLLDIAVMANKVEHLLDRLRRLLAKGGSTPYVVRVERARAKYLTRQYWDMLHRLCVHEVGLPRFRSTGGIGHIIEAIRGRLSEAVAILRPHDQLGTVERDIATLFEFLTPASPDDWEVLKELVPGALSRVGTVVDRSTSPEGVFVKGMELSDAAFRRAAAVHIRAFMLGEASDGLVGASGKLLPPKVDHATSGRGSGGSSARPRDGHAATIAPSAPAAPATPPVEDQCVDPKLGVLVPLGADLVLAPEALTVLHEGSMHRFDKRRKQRFDLLRLLAKRANLVTKVAHLAKNDDKIGWEGRELSGHGLRNAARRLAEELKPVLPKVAQAIEIAEERKSHYVIFNWPPPGSDAAVGE